jgi:cellobiose phosphorylase
MYPGLPEYTGPDGRGYYFYLTGSASWYMFTLITQAFGIRGEDGDLVLDPKLMAEQFDDAGNASIRSHLAGQELEIRYKNLDRLDIGEYRVGRILIDGKDIAFSKEENHTRIERRIIRDLPPGDIQVITVELIR